MLPNGPTSLITVLVAVSTTVSIGVCRPWLSRYARVPSSEMRVLCAEPSWGAGGGGRPGGNVLNEVLALFMGKEKNPVAPLTRRFPAAGEGDVKKLLTVPRPTRPTRPTSLLLPEHLHDRRGNLAGVGK